MGGGFRVEAQPILHPKPKLKILKGLTASKPLHRKGSGFRV